MSPLPHLLSDAPSLRFVITVVYEDDQTRDRAIHLCDQMADDLENEVHFDFSWWKFAFLRDPVMARQASEAASQADMVIISTHPGDEFPEVFKNWVESWILRRKTGAAALVGLVGPTDPEHHGLCRRHNYFLNAAVRGHMDYLPEGVLPTPPTGNTLRTVEYRAETFSPMLQEILAAKHPMRDWGLNE